MNDELDRLTKEARLLGFIDGLNAYAHMADGKYYVGTTGTRLSEAIKLAQQGKTWNQSAEDYPSPEVPSEF